MLNVESAHLKIIYLLIKYTLLPAVQKEHK